MYPSGNLFNPSSAAEQARIRAWQDYYASRGQSGNYQYQPQTPQQYVGQLSQSGGPQYNSNGFLNNSDWSLPTWGNNQ
jgi:hypothetical protein